MPKRKLKTYKVKVSPHLSYTAKAYSVDGARKRVWRDMQDGYTYGYKSKSDFLSRAKVDQVFYKT